MAISHVNRHGPIYTGGHQQRLNALSSNVRIGCQGKGLLELIRDQQDPVGAETSAGHRGEQIAQSGTGGRCRCAPAADNQVIDIRHQLAGHALGELIKWLFSDGGRWPYASYLWAFPRCGDGRDLAPVSSPRGSVTTYHNPNSRPLPPRAPGPFSEQLLCALVLAEEQPGILSLKNLRASKRAVSRSARSRDGAFLRNASLALEPAPDCDRRARRIPGIDALVLLKKRRKGNQTRSISQHRNDAETGISQGQSATDGVLERGRPGFAGLQVVLVEPNIEAGPPRAHRRTGWRLPYPHLNGSGRRNPPEHLAWRCGPFQTVCQFILSSCASPGCNPILRSSVTGFLPGICELRCILACRDFEEDRGLVFWVCVAKEIS